MKNNLILHLAMALLISSVGSLIVDDSPVPLPWPEKVFVALSQNATDPKTGDLQTFNVQMKWYDWTQNSMRSECIQEGSDLSMVFMVKEKTGYIFDMSERYCIKLDMPVGVITRDWFSTNSTFLGFESLDGLKVGKWEKLQHYYYAAAGDYGRPVRVIAPFDRHGFKVEMNYAAFVPGKVHKSGLTIPDVCTADLSGRTDVNSEFLKAVDRAKARCFQIGQNRGSSAMKMQLV